LLTFIIVGSLLGPAVVGVMTMALITILFLATLFENGFADALIQRSDLHPEHFNSAFWLMLSLGVALAVVLWLATPIVALAFSEPQLGDILPIMGIALPCIAVTDCYSAMLRRELKFHSLAIRSILAYGSALVAAVSLAASGYGIYSLVAFFLVSRGLQPVLLVAATRMWPGLRITPQSLREIVDFGKHRVGNEFIGYIGRSLDRFAVGIFLGPVALGLYAVAERMVAALTNGIAGVLMRVAFPTLASKQEDRERFDAAMQKFLTIANLIALPAFAGLAVTAPDMIDVLFSEKWMPAAPLMTVLSLAGLVMPTNYILVAATNALGRADLVFKLSMAMLVLRVVAYLVTAQIGVTAVAIAKTGTAAVALLIFLFAARNLFGARWLRHFRGVWIPIAATASMATAVVLIDPLLHDTGRVAALIGDVLFGAAVYAAQVWVLAPRTCRKLLQW
jgi:PST family polysaccharide transporter